MTVDKVIEQMADDTRGVLAWWLTNRVNQARLDLGMLVVVTPDESVELVRPLRRGEPDRYVRRDGLVIHHFDGTWTLAIDPSKKFAQTP